MMLDRTHNAFTPKEREYIRAFGTPEKEMTIPEFVEYWLSLTEREQGDMRMDFYLQTNAA